MELELKRKHIQLAILSILLTVSLSAQQIIHNGKMIYLSNTLIVKVENSSTLPQLKNMLAKHAISNVTEIFPTKGILTKNYNSHSLAEIYLIKYNAKENPAELAAKVAKLPGILWAEPKYVRRICFVPNDSIFTIGDQDNLLQIGSAQAWDITTGNKNIIIGIVDTGVDWGHPDLAANIYMENDSLIPGSDLGNLDNDPSEDINQVGKYHGTHIAGIASAVTNNEIGIASMGFNCMILPVKTSKEGCFDSAGFPLILYGFEGIKWAADHGAKVINCSWGGYGFSSYEQSIIDYVLEKGSVVVASQGNDSSSACFYPANYDGVLSVGWLNTGSGVKTIHPHTNFGEKVMVFAPGSKIYSTWQRPTQSSAGIYKTAYGSSQAAPHVSGLAGLVWSEFPSYSPIQVVERIRVTSDYIDDYNASSYKNFLGHGVINASRAVNKSFNAISVRANNIRFNGNGNREKLFGPGEEIYVRADFTNYLAMIDDITITLTTTDSFVTFENSTFNTGPMDTMTTISNDQNKFKFRIAANTPNDHIIRFLLKYSNGADYNDFQSTSIKIINTYYTHKNNNITFTLTSKGTLGFNDYPYNIAGEGFKYRGSGNLMLEGALMYGISSSQVMNEARILDSQKKNFIYEGPMKIFSSLKDYVGSTCFSDSGAGTDALGIKVTQLSRTLSTPPENNYIFLRCELQNETSQDIDHLYAGYFIDWNISENDYEADSTYFDTTKNVAIACNTKNSASPYIAMALTSAGEKCGFYAIDNKITSGPVQISDNDGFTDAEKWYTLSNGLKQISAGISDISYVISAGPYNIQAGQFVVAQFIIAGGSTLQEALQAIKEGRIRYGDEEDPEESIPFTFQLYQNYPNPFNLSTTIKYELPKRLRSKIEIFDILGRNSITLVNEIKEKGSNYVIWNAQNFASGIYFYRLQAGNNIEVKKLLLLK
jgi:serine protease